MIRKVLNNGIRVVMEPMENYTSVALGVWIDAGSANETKKNNGIAHVVEHMLFKGTKTRTARDIADEMTAIGGNLDAYTSKECTCYYTRTLGEYAYTALEIIADMIKNSKIDANDLKKEIGVILDEIDMYEDDADELVHEQLQKKVWGEHPLGFIISGEKAVVKNFTPRDVRQFMDVYYTGSHIVISVAGSFDENTLLEAVENLFGDIPSGCNSAADIVSSGCMMPAVYTQKILCRHKDIEQMHLDLAFDCIAYDHEDKYVMAVANSILGGNLNSRLFQKVREELGLAYTIYSYGSSYKHCGLFQIYAAMAPKQTAVVLDAILASVEEMCSVPVGERELQLTKQQIRAELLMATESTHHRMESNAKAWLYLKRAESISETIARIDAVSAADIMSFMKKYMSVNKVSMALIGNFDGFGFRDINQLLTRWGILSKCQLEDKI